MVRECMTLRIRQFTTSPRFLLFFIMRATGPLTLVITLIALLCAAPALAAGPNRVLDLDGDGDFIELPAGIFTELQEATVEAWVRWGKPGRYAQVIGFGSQWQTLGINTWEATTALQFFIYDRDRNLHLVSSHRFYDYESTGLLLPIADFPIGDLLTNQWRHIAAVSGPGGMKLFLDGVLVGADDYTGSFADIGDGSRNLIGRPHWDENEPFEGQIDEVRVWATSRTRTQIRAAMHQRLSGDEEGLVGLWNFDGDCAQDRSPSGHHGALAGDARCIEQAWPTAAARLAVVHGRVSDSAGEPMPDAKIRAERDGVVQANTFSDRAGQYSLPLVSCQGCDLVAEDGDLGVWHIELDLAPGRLRRDLRLSEATRLSGQVTTWEPDEP